MARKAKITSAERIERQQRIASILSMRLQGASLRQIGDAYAISAQAVFKCVSKALAEIVNEAAEQARKLELARLDELLGGIYEQALNGDIAAIDRVLAISYRRARLMGLDLQTGGQMRFGDYGPVEQFDENGRPVVRVEIIGDPEVARREWLFQKRIAALGGNPDIDDEPSTPATPHSVN